MDELKNTVFVYEKLYNAMKDNEYVVEIIEQAIPKGFKIISNPYIKDGYAYVYDGEGVMKTIYIGLIY